jgi:MFS family permease
VRVAGNLGTLIAFRVLQAIPGGVMPVVAMTLVYRIVPREKLGAAMGVFGLGIILGPAAGPVLGGYFVQYLDWRLVFYVNVPVGIIWRRRRLLHPAAHPRQGGPPLRPARLPVHRARPVRGAAGGVGGQ